MKDKLIELAKNNDIELEINKDKVEGVRISSTNDKIDLFNISNITGYKIKAIKNDKCISFFTNNIDDTKTIIDNINKMLELSDNDNKNRLCTGNITNRLKTRHEYDYNEIKNDLTRLYKELKEEYKELSSLQTEFYTKMQGYYITNSNCELIDEYEYNSFGISYTLSKGNDKKSVYYNMYSKEYNYETIKNSIENSIKTTLIKLNCGSCKTDKYNIILANKCVDKLLYYFSDMYFSKYIDLNTSILSGKYNTKIFDEKINIIEDPMKKDAYINRIFDDEGIKTSYKEIIKDGKFIKKLNNLEYAIKNNEEPTGNSYGIMNLYLKPGDYSFDELIKKLNNGIIIDNIEGLHAGVDKKTGNISVLAEGLVVKDGKIVDGLNMILLASNLFEIFNNVEAIGNDMSTTLPAVFAPSLLLNDITITGKN